VKGIVGNNAKNITFTASLGFILRGPFYNNLKSKIMLSKRFMSLTVHTIYVVLTGLQLIFTPNMLLSMFGFDPTSEVWIRVLGLVVLSLAFMYNASNQYGDANVVKSTVMARLLVGIGFVVLALTQDKANLILFGGLDIATGLWTWFEMKKKSI
jgi:hypothetical protein